MIESRLVILHTSCYEGRTQLIKFNAWILVIIHDYCFALLLHNFQCPSKNPVIHFGQVCKRDKSILCGKLTALLVTCPTREVAMYHIEKRVSLTLVANINHLASTTLAYSYQWRVWLAVRVGGWLGCG